MHIGMRMFMLGSPLFGIRKSMCLESGGLSLNNFLYKYVDDIHLNLYSQYVLVHCRRRITVVFGKGGLRATHFEARLAKARLQALKSRCSRILCSASLHSGSASDADDIPLSGQGVDESSSLTYSG